VQEGPYLGVRDEGFGVDALHFWVIGVAVRWSYFPWIGEVCSGHSEEVWYGGLQAYVYPLGDQLEEY
jgi:hypothetical protein